MIYVILGFSIIVCLILAVDYEIKKNKKLSIKPNETKKFKMDIVVYFKVMTKEEYDEYEDYILDGKEEKYLTNKRMLEFEHRLNELKNEN